MAQQRTRNDNEQQNDNVSFLNDKESVKQSQGTLYSQIYLFPANWRSREVDYYMIASSPHAPVCLSVSICNISVYNRGLLRPEFHSQPRLARLMPLTADV